MPARRGTLGWDVGRYPGDGSGVVSSGSEHVQRAADVAARILARHEPGAREAFEHEAALVFAEAGQPGRVGRQQLLARTHRDEQMLQTIERFVLVGFVLHHVGQSRDGGRKATPVPSMRLRFSGAMSRMSCWKSIEPRSNATGNTTVLSFLRV